MQHIEFQIRRVALPGLTHRASKLRCHRRALIRIAGYPNISRHHGESILGRHKDRGFFVPVLTSSRRRQEL